MASFILVIIPHLLCTLIGKRDLLAPLFLGVLGWIAGLRITVKGEARKHALLLGNHVSWLDIFAMAGTCRTAFVAQAGLAQNKALEWLCLQNETLFITRDIRQSVVGQVDDVMQRLGHRRLTIFPETTTNDGKTLLPFRSSLLSAVERLPHDIPVQPFALDFKDAEDIAWFGDEPGLANFARIMGRTRPVELVINFLDPLTGNELTNRKTMAAAAQEKVEAALSL